MKNEKIKTRLVEEIDQFVNQSGVGDLYDVLDLDSLSELTYLQQCFNEALRWEAPLSRSTSMCMSEDVELPTFTMKANTIFVVDMYTLHRSKRYWKDPEQFIPERFDPTSEYFLTPDGKKRHTLTFTPFLGGKRICIGKTFAETSSKFIIALFMNKCGKYLSFVNDSDYSKLPRNNALLFEVPEIIVKSDK